MHIQHVAQLSMHPGAIVKRPPRWGFPTKTRNTQRPFSVNKSTPTNSKAFIRGQGSGQGLDLLDNLLN